MIKVVRPELLKNYGFSEFHGSFTKKLPVTYANQFKDGLGIGDEPTLYIACDTLPDRVDDGREINELYTYVEGMNNDYAGSASLDAVAELLSDGVAVIERGAS